MKRKFLLFLAALLCLASFGGCQTALVNANNTKEDDQKLTVVSTIFPPYDFVRQIAGDSVFLSMLLSPGAESHSYDPTPQDIIAIQNCDVFLYVGGDSDQWVERILESIDTEGVTMISLMDLVEVVEEEIVEGMEHDDHDDYDDNHGDKDDHEFDEHVWTSPKNAVTIVEAISETLCLLDAGNAELYSANTQDHVSELLALDRGFQELVDSAARKTVIFGDRFPFRYFADAYSLTYYAAFPGCSTETEASAATVAFLIDKINEEKIPVVFHIELSNEQMADAIAESTGAKKMLLHSCHNVSRDDFAAGVTYVELMKQNLENLKEALS